MKLQINWDLIRQNAFVKKVFGNVNVDKSREFFACTDSRQYKPNDIFITIKGENFDGFSYAEDVIKMGCEILTFEDTPVNVSLVLELVKKYPKVSFLACSSSLEFYQELAREYGQIWKKNKKGRLVIGITGSSGKTTQKEMLFHYLNALFPGRVYATEKNYNNHIGVPRTMLQLSEKIDYAIVEMGTNHVGEIKILCDIAIPDAGIITTIGEAHIGYFKTKENIFTEKSRLFNAVMENSNNLGYFVLDYENNYLKKLPPHKNVIFYNSKNIPCSYENNQVRINYQKSEIILQNSSLIGRHNFSNLVSTFLLSTSLFPGEENRKRLIEAASSFTTFKNRSSLIEDNGRTIFLDAYNASPSAMMASVEGFLDYCKKNRIANENAFYILGDMNELGDLTEDLHTQTGKFLKDKQVTKVAFVGKYNQFYAQGYQQPSIRCATLEEFIRKHWSELKKEYIYFFIKGSRSLKLESILDAAS